MLWVVVGLWVWVEVSDFIFFFWHHLTCWLFFVYGRLQDNLRKEGRKEGKRWRYILNSNFIWVFFFKWLFCGEKVPPKQVEKCHFPQTRRWKIFKSFSMDGEFKVSSFVQWVFFNWDHCYRRHNLPSPQSETGGARAQPASGTTVNAEIRTDFHLVSVSLSFMHAQISLPVRDFRELLHIFSLFINFHIVRQVLGWKNPNILLSKIKDKKKKVSVCVCVCVKERDKEILNTVPLPIWQRSFGYFGRNK